MAMTARRFLRPWSIEDIGAAFVVKDSGGQKLGYFYYEEEPARRHWQRNIGARRGETRRIAVTSFYGKPKRKDMRVLFCAAHLVLNTFVDEFGALVEW